VEIVDEQWLRLTLQNIGGATLVVRPGDNIVDNQGYPRTGGIFLRWPGSPPDDSPFIFTMIESSMRWPAPLGLAAGDGVTASYFLEALIARGFVAKQHLIRSPGSFPADLEYRVVVWWNYPPREADYMITDWRKFSPAPDVTSATMSATPAP
jgi:hypothetical protein